MFIAYGLLLFIMIPWPVMKLCFCCGWAWFLGNRNSCRQTCIFLLVIAAYLLSAFYPFQPILEGRILSQSDTSVLIGTRWQTTRIWGAYTGDWGDVVRVRGVVEACEGNVWNGLRRTRHEVSDATIETVAVSASYKTSLWTQSEDYPYIRKILFNQYNDDLGMLTSLSLQGSGLIFLIDMLTKRYGNETMNIYAKRVTVILLAWLLPGFATLRLALKQFRTWIPYHAEIILMMCMFPHTHTYLGFLFVYGPYWVRNLTYRLRDVERGFIAPLLSLFLNYRFNLFEYLSYRMLSIYAAVVYSLAHLPLFYPMTEWIIEQGTAFWSAAVFERLSVYGHLGLLVMILILYIACIKQRRVLLLFYACLCVWLTYIPFPAITFIDVGQGDAALIRFPFNAYRILIDTGRKQHMQTLQKALWKHGVGSLDTLILTHQDQDHSENEAYLIEHFSVAEVINDKSDEVRGLQPLLNDQIYEGSNENSLIYGISLQGIRFLFMGDAAIAQEADILRYYPDLKADVVKLGHHGSKTSSSESFLAQLESRYAIISADPAVYGHPHSDIQERLYRLRIQPLETYKEGTITFLFLPGFTVMLTEGQRFAIINAR